MLSTCFDFILNNLFSCIFFKIIVIRFIRAGGGVGVFSAIILLFGVSQTVRVVSDWWVSRWSQDALGLSNGQYAYGEYVKSGWILIK